MKWQNWLAQLEQLPPDAPEWDSYADFLVALEQLGAAKLHERAEAHTALAQALQSLQEKYGSSLANFGQGSLLSFTPESCPSRRALRVVRHLNELSTLLGGFDELLHRTPSSPDEYREWRRLRNVQEDEIMDSCDGLTRLLSATEEAEAEVVSEVVEDVIEEIPAPNQSLKPLNLKTLKRPKKARISMKFLLKHWMKYPYETTTIVATEVTVVEETIARNGHGSVVLLHEAHSHRTLEIIDETADHHLNVLDLERRRRNFGRTGIEERGTTAIGSRNGRCRDAK